MGRTKSAGQTGIVKPMLGESVHDIKSLPYPLGATYKVDGVRALIIDGQLKSRSLKPIRNLAIAKALESYLPNGADGEIVVGNTFQDTTSAVMTRFDVNQYDFTGTFYWFDWVIDGNLNEPYQNRCDNIYKYIQDHPPPIGFTVTSLLPQVVRNADDLDEFNIKALQNGFEGVVVRDMNGPYKCGRSTLRQAYMLKIKCFIDDEAEIVGVTELMHNENLPAVNELGYISRSSHKNNKLPAGILGALCVRNRKGVKFNIGTGFTSQQRHDFWIQRHDLLGKLVKYKYFAIGVVDAPRHPVFLGFRHMDDL